MSPSCALSTTLGASLLIVVGAVVAAGQEPARQVVATIDGRAIHLDEVEPRLGLEAYRLQADLHRLLERGVRELVDDRLLAREADRRGVTVEEFLVAEVDAHLAQVGDAEVDAYLAARDRSGDGPEVRTRVRSYLEERARIARRLEVLAELRSGVDLELLVEPPAPPRVAIDLAGLPRRGADQPDVSVVHFAGFRCPRCAESARWLEALVDEHPERVAWFHHSALSRVDDLALSAAELAAEAQAAGRFWPVHDRLMAYEGRLTTDDLGLLAADAGLAEVATPEALAGVVASRRADLGRELAEAERLGVSQAPVVFVNGRYFHPSFGREALEELVADELARTAPAASVASPAGDGGRSESETESETFDPPAAAGREESHVPEIP